MSFCSGDESDEVKMRAHACMHTHTHTYTLGMKEREQREGGGRREEGGDIMTTNSHMGAKR